MIKAAPAKAAAARSRPRPKKPANKSDESGAANASHVADSEITHASNSTAAAADAKQKPKRRRTAPKKKEFDSDTETRSHNHQPDASNDSHRSTAATASQPLGLATLQRATYTGTTERAPRLLPDITGVLSVTTSEAQSDLRAIQSTLAAFEARVAALDATSSQSTKPIERVDATERSSVHMNAPHRPLYQPQTPEALLATLPASRRAVRVTQRELLALKRERDDLERSFMHLRQQIVNHAQSMHAAQKTHRRVVSKLANNVVTIAKDLETSRRRTHALQNILNELEARGTQIVRLTREKNELQRLLGAHNVALPDVDDVMIGDRVVCSLGSGDVVAMDVETRIVTLSLDKQGEPQAFVQADDVTVLQLGMTYVEAEKALKQRFFDAINAFVQPPVTTPVTTTPTTTMTPAITNGRRTSGSATSDVDALVVALGGTLLRGDESDESESESDESESASESEEDEEVDKRSVDTLTKKRKLHMVLLPSAAAAATDEKKKKRKQQQRVLEFPATTLALTPFETPVRVSPLSTLPDRVAAISTGQSTTQWHDAYLPSKLIEWENERLESLQLRGDVERLRFQLQRAEAEKRDAQQHASDQLESINALVTQLDKLREAAKATGSSSSLSTSSSCPHCHATISSTTTTSTNGSRKHKTAKATKRENAKRVARVDDEKGDKMDEKDGGDVTHAVESREEANGAEAGAADVDENGDDDDRDGGAESSDSGAMTNPVTARSLRPRRKPTIAAATTTTTTASPKSLSR